MDNDIVKKVMSPYLLQGYKQDNIGIESVDFRTEGDKSKFTFNLKINESPITSKYGVFLSGITAEVWIYQACVVFAHLDNDLDKNSREVILQDKQITYEKPVSPDNFFVTVEAIEKRPASKGRIQYKFGINVGDAITGSGNAIF